jgi:hypothetical protein
VILKQVNNCEPLKEGSVPYTGWLQMMWAILTNKLMWSLTSFVIILIVYILQEVMRHESKLGRSYKGCYIPESRQCMDVNGQIHASAVFIPGQTARNPNWSLIIWTWYWKKM